MQNSNWFANNLQQPYPLTPPPSGRRRIIKLVIILIVIAMLITAGTIGAYFLRPTCLTATNYQQLANVPYDGELNATQEFYTALVYFQTNKTNYDNSDDQGESQLKSFADFYRYHSNASIAFTLTTSYPDDIYQELSTQRLAAAKQSLVTLGVPETSITTTPPQEIAPEEPFDEASTIGSHNAITVSISSQEGCR